VRAGDGVKPPFDIRCFFAGGSAGVDGGEGAPRCMNFMPASREDIVLGCFPGVAIICVWWSNSAGRVLKSQKVVGTLEDFRYCPKL
jgi:hypothetical protein